MQKHEENLASRIHGNALQPLSGITVTVVNDATGLPASLYSDNGVTPITGAVTTDDNGYYSFYAADGKYTVTHAGVRLSVPVVRKIILEDPDDNPAATLGQLAASGGGDLVSTIASGTGAVVRKIKAKLRERITVFDFMTEAEIAGVQDGSFAVDVTAAIQAAANYVNSSRLAATTTSGALTTSYSGTGSTLHFPRGCYRISSTITIGGYTAIQGEDAIIKQITDTADHFVWESYQVSCRGMQFVGGKFAFDIFNMNLNSTIIDIDRCHFFLTRNYAINTRSTAGGGSHLSAKLAITKTRFIACNKVLNNCCDDATISDSWIQVSKDNFAVSSAAILNRGTAVETDALTRLTIKNTFMIPDIGVEGVDRINGAHWIDNYGSFTAQNTRFGGENAGMSILWNYGVPNTAIPYSTTEAVFEGCYLFAGPDARTDSCVVGIQGQIPNRVVIRNCTGPVGRPLIANLSGLAIPAYMAAYEAASSRKAYEYFKIDIGDAIFDINAYSPTRAIIPTDLYPYLVRGRKMEIARVATQAIANGFVTNHISFDTINSESIKAWDIANPTRIVMPKGCTRMGIGVHVKMAVDGTAKTYAVTLQTVALVRVAGETMLRGNNGDADRFTFYKEVTGAPDSYWHINIQHNSATASINLLECQVTLTPLDHIS